MSTPTYETDMTSDIRANKTNVAEGQIGGAMSDNEISARIHCGRHC